MSVIYEVSSRKFYKVKKISVLILASFLFIFSYTASAQRPNITVTHFRDSAESSAWCQYDSTLVAYNLLQANGYWGIYMANVTPANTMINERCFTCGKAFLPGKHYANPAFSPNKRYILFMAEKAVHSGTSDNSIPGIGMYNDLWVMKTDGSKAWRLTTLPSTGNNSAMIEPYFSPDGKEIQWDEMTDSVNIGVLKQSFGYWVVKIAPFIDDTLNGPHLDSTHIRVITPGGTQAFNESYGWSPDGSRMLFASCYNQFWPLDDQIYTMDTLGNNIQQMSSTAHGYPYTEHAFYNTDGSRIIWMTNLYNTIGSSKGGDDWWIMNSDTTHQERLTYFNDTLCSYYTGSIHINGHGSFAPSGKKFIGDVGGSAPVQTNPAASIGANYIIGTPFLSGIQPVTQTELNTCFVYPNPTSDFIKVSLNAATNNLHYSIFNLVGSKLAEGQFSGKNTTINVSLLPSGVYFLQLHNETSTINKKFVVERK